MTIHQLLGLIEELEGHGLTITDILDLELKLFELGYKYRETT